jgi:hypothetical protein
MTSPSSNRGETFAGLAADVERQIGSAEAANAARRDQLYGGRHGAQYLRGHFTDVSPLLRGSEAAGRGYNPPQQRFDPYGGFQQHAAIAQLPQQPVLTTTEAVERQVQDAVSRALRAHEDRVSDIVAREWDRRTQELEHALRNRFTDIQVMSDGTGRILRDVGAQVAALKAELAVSNESHEAALAALGTELRARIADLGRSVNREVVSLREIVLDLQSRFSVDTAEYSRKIDAAQRRSIEAQDQAMTAVQQRVNAAKAEIEASTRGMWQKVQDEIDAAVRLVSQSNDAAERGEAAVHRLESRVADALEDAAIRRSETRTLRDDIQQLELYVKGRIDRIAASTARGAAGASAATAGASGGPILTAELDRLQRDVYTLQQGLSYITGRLNAYGFLDDDVVQDVVRPPKAAQPRDTPNQNLAVSDLTVPTASAMKKRQSYDSRHDEGAYHRGTTSPTKSEDRVATKATRRYSQVVDPFQHSAHSFVGNDEERGEMTSRDDDSDASNQKLALHHVD